MGVEPEDFEMVAASLRADASDVPHFIEVLARKLEGALPGLVEVERHAKKMFSHDKVVRRIVIQLGDWQYSLDAEGGGQVACSRAKAVRGIVLKTEQVQLPSWIDCLAKDLSAQAATNEQARIALERLLT